MKIRSVNNKQRVIGLKAFTLVELLAVIAVMLLILKMTLPTLDGLLGSDAQAMARSQLIGDLNRARSLALEKGVPVYVVFMPLYDDIDFTPAAGKPGFFNSNSATNALLGKQLNAYAFYAKYLPGDRPDNGAEVWLSDWKQLPPGYNLDPLVLGAMPERIDLRYLSLPRPRPDLPLKLTMPALKYLPDGRLDGVDLNGFYLSISRGGMLPPQMGAGGFYLPENADPPEEVADEDKEWIQVNAITGRATMVDLTDEGAELGVDMVQKMNGQGFNIYINSSPKWPLDLQREIANTFAGQEKFFPMWLKVQSQNWVPRGGQYPLSRSHVNGPVFKNLSQRDALEKKRDLSGRFPGVGLEIVQETQ